MTIEIPKAPEFGDPLPIEPSPEVLTFLARRRSASALTLRVPGPSDDEIDDLLRLAARVPDHGKLSPWRFIVLTGEAKSTVARRLEALAQGRADHVKARAALGKFNAPPVAVVVVSRPASPSDIPEWEQVLSAGAVCLTLLNAALAMGYGANWITDWYSTDEAGKGVLGVATDERVAGVVYIGTANEPPLERVRPDLAKLTTRP